MPSGGFRCDSAKNLVFVQVMPMSKANPSDGKYRIDSRPKIHALLNHLGKVRSPLGIRPFGETKILASVMHALDDRQKYIQLQQIADAQAHENVLRIRKIRVHANLDGVVLKFLSEVMDSTTDNAGRHIYLSSVPDYLLYFQKRDNQRLSLRAQQVEVTTLACDGSFLSGQLEDISVEGVGLNFTDTSSLGIGDRLRETRFRLPSGEVFQCSLVIRSMVNRPSHVRVGCEFNCLQDACQQKLNHTIAQLIQQKLFSYE
jgi:c-di-GMP-binding flagellar brake protein YcgR